MYSQAKFYIGSKLDGSAQVFLLQVGKYCFKISIDVVRVFENNLAGWQANCRHRRVSFQGEALRHFRSTWSFHTHMQVYFGML